MFKNTNNNILRNIITTYLYGQTDNFCWILVVVSRHSAPLRPLLAEYCFLSKQLTGCTPSDLSRWPICFSVRLHTHTHQKNPGKTLSLSLSFYPSPLRPVRTALAAAKRSVPVYTFFVPPPFLFSPRFSFFKHRGQGFSFLKKKEKKKRKKRNICTFWRAENAKNTHSAEKHDKRSARSNRKNRKYTHETWLGQLFSVNSTTAKQQLLTLTHTTKWTSINKFCWTHSRRFAEIINSTQTKTKESRRVERWNFCKANCLQITQKDVCGCVCVCVFYSNGNVEHWNNAHGEQMACDEFFILTDDGKTEGKQSAGRKRNNETFWHKSSKQIICTAIGLTWSKYV